MPTVKNVISLGCLALGAYLFVYGLFAPLADCGYIPNAPDVRPVFIRDSLFGGHCEGRYRDYIFTARSTPNGTAGQAAFGAGLLAVGIAMRLQRWPAEPPNPTRGTP